MNWTNSFAQVFALRPPQPAKALRGTTQCLSNSLILLISANTHLLFYVYYAARVM